MAIKHRTKKRSSKAEIARLDRAFIVRNMLEDGITQSDVGRYFGISRQAVNQLLNRHKLQARKNIYKAIKAGHISKPVKCTNCDQTEHLEAHHNDHYLSLDVIWLCRPCHVKYDNKGHKIK